MIQLDLFAARDFSCWLCQRLSQLVVRPAVAYLRVSSDRQQGNTSIPDQEVIVRRFAASRGVEIVATFVDDGVSARTRDDLTESFSSRPGWQSLRAYLRANPVARGGPEMVLFRDYRRFSRDTAAAWATIRELRRIGVEVQAAEQPIDWSVPEQKILVGVYITDGEVDNERRSATTRRGMVKALSEGRYIHRPPFGYRALHEGGRRLGIEVCPETGPLAADALARVAAGEKPSAVFERLRLAAPAQMMTSRGRFYEWMRSRVLLGETHVPPADGAPGYWRSGTHSPLVERAVWERVQDVLDGAAVPAQQARKTRFWAEIPLRGLLRCPRTGAALTGSRSKSKQGVYHWYYHGQGAGAYRVPAGVAHAAVQAWMDAQTLSPGAAAIWKAVAEDVAAEYAALADRRRTELLAQLDALNVRRVRAAEAAVEGRIDSDGYARLAAQYHRAEADLQAKLATAPPTENMNWDDLAWALDLFANLGQVYRAAPPQTKRDLVGSIMPAGLKVSDGAVIEPLLVPPAGLLIADSEPESNAKAPAASEETAGARSGDPDGT